MQRGHNGGEGFGLPLLDRDVVDAQFFATRLQNVDDGVDRTDQHVGMPAQDLARNAGFRCQFRQRGICIVGDLGEERRALDVEVLEAIGRRSTHVSHSPSRLGEWVESVVIARHERDVGDARSPAPPIMIGG